MADTEEIVAPEEEGQVERYGAYTRINPSGHREQVIKKKGKTDEETLNELADSLMQLLEGSPETSMPSGECWYCGKPKDNVYGLCMGCGRFGKPQPVVREPQFATFDQLQTPIGQVPWEGPDPTVGAERVFTPHRPGMSSEQDYVRRQGNTRAGFEEPIEQFDWDKWDRRFGLRECAEEYIWKYVSDSLPEEIREWPGFKELVDNLIGEGLEPEEIVRRVDAAYWDD